MIESVPFSYVLQGAVTFSLWIIFVMTLVLFFSTLMKSTAAVAFLSLGVTIIISLLSSIVPEIMRWSPSMLVSHSHMFFQTGSGGEAFFLSVSITFLLIITMVVTESYVFQQKEIAIHTT
ncbi:hypothetical protein J2S74_003222 [Evansella vedderi]|uniref:NADH dehydrogenase subunit 6 n=1 Tax=Evansella vedderi TaxID=38282 RepID=A0ABT9ZX84_9BACI|nr:hypothetical protein [Evansella vedderi]MDQ0255838.1 hypothetical protein [Evansella vedderi]